MFTAGSVLPIYGEVSAKPTEGLRDVYSLALSSPFMGRCRRSRRRGCGVLTPWLGVRQGRSHCFGMAARRTFVSRRMRTSMTGTELRVWIRLRGRKLDGWKFRRQQPIGPYYVDFYCPAARLVIEIDGPTHDDARWAYDLRRQAWLEAEGYKVIRIPVSDIDLDAGDAVEAIAIELEEREKLGFTRRPFRPPSPSAA